MVNRRLNKSDVFSIVVVVVVVAAAAEKEHIRKIHVVQKTCDASKTAGWKLVHGDVFRPPRYGMLLSLFLGSGVQIFFMTMITLGNRQTGVAIVSLHSLSSQSCFLHSEFVAFVAVFVVYVANSD